ncbi:hypothetical protein RHSIM_Rhsim05G0183600 [Rhododendron simsii]|uniref:MLO-like protein n=1 Tax=Rhododendron simsii TaxID=118357 RepID=A0A834LNM7_RHOSS|nr:hypothetical protein RHSIM_Rhsim05G0183600 [Rhododendron simsii]
MLVGFISLLLTVGQGPISEICVSEAIGASWHPCDLKQESTKYGDDYSSGDDNRRKLLNFVDSGESRRRFLASDKLQMQELKERKENMGQVPFVSTYGIHQLHIFIFVLAVFHVLYCIITLALGRAKAGFFRQFVTSVAKVDYLTLRHGFISAHLGPESRTNFDFQQYIKRSLEEDFKVVVGIRGDIVKGTPMVQPGDELFWFNRPRLLLYLIQFILFQNAFQLAFFAWAWYEFGLRSCFHEKLEDIIIRVTMGVLIQIVCSYVTLPLYALVTQMGSTMKPTIFNDQIAKALRNWHQTAKKHIKQNRHSPGTVTPLQSRPGTPLHGASPIHLLRNYRSEIDSVSTSPRISNFENVVLESDGPPSRHRDRHRDLVAQQETEGVQESSLVTSASEDVHLQHEIDIHLPDFSYENAAAAYQERPSSSSLLLLPSDLSLLNLKLYISAGTVIRVDSVGTISASFVTYASILALQPDLIINVGTAGGLKIDLFSNSEKLYDLLVVELEFEIFEGNPYGWAFADSVLNRWSPLWVGARGLEFTWDYILQGLDANASQLYKVVLAGSQEYVLARQSLTFIV